MKRLKLAAKLEALEEVLAFMDEYLEELECPMKINMQLDIALEEMYVNVAHYAYPDENADGQGMAEILLEPLTDNKGIRITLIDQGIPYNPLAKVDPDITLSAEERQIGGLGIFMVKKSMDKLDYRYENESNIFSMEKCFV